MNKAASVRVLLIGGPRAGGRNGCAEGMEVISSNLGKRLGGVCKTFEIALPALLKPGAMRDIRRFSPDIIHFLHGPSMKTLLACKALKLLTPGSKTVVSMTNPRIKAPWLWMLPALKPSLALTQSGSVDFFLRGIGFETAFFPNGVDTERFKPAEGPRKLEIRRKYNIGPERFVLLHVGHIRKNRGLDTLARLQDSMKDIQVVVAGSTRFTREEGIERRLKASGCMIFVGYFESIDELYKLADCYIFPVRARGGGPFNRLSGSIETPLSVLEAMSTNLPVVSTPYGALPELFRPGGGLYFYETGEQLEEAIRRIRAGGGQSGNRQLALHHEWRRLVLKLERIYRGLLAGEADRLDKVPIV